MDIVHNILSINTSKNWDILLLNYISLSHPRNFDTSIFFLIHTISTSPNHVLNRCFSNSGFSESCFAFNCHAPLPVPYGSVTRTLFKKGSIQTLTGCPVT